MEDTSKNIEQDEITLAEIFNTIWQRRKIVYKTIGIFVLLGLVIAYGIKVEYTAYCKLLQESNQNTNMNLGGGLAGLAGLAGINLNNISSAGAITPDLYPEVTQSIPFQLQVLNQPIFFQKENSTFTSFYYFKEIYTPSIFEFFYTYVIRLPYQVKYWLNRNENNKSIDQNSEILRISREDLILIEKFKDRINVSIDPQTGIITLSTIMPDPNAAAEITNTAYKMLTEYLIKYKINKASLNMDYVERLYEDAKGEYENAQQSLAIFNDRNRNVITAVAKTEQQILQNEYNITFEVYKGLASQLEQAKIAVKEETPVFTILEPVKLPIDKSKPRRTITLLVSILLGLIFGSLYALIKKN